MRPSYADGGVERGTEDSAVAGGRAPATDLGDFRRQTIVTCRASLRNRTLAARVSAAATQEHHGDSKRRRRLSCTEQQPSEVTQCGQLQQSNSQQQQQQWEVQQRQGWQSQRPRHTWEQALHQPNVQQQNWGPEGHQRRSDERQEQHYLLHSTSPRPRWKEHGRWPHSSTGQQQDHPLLQGEAGMLRVSDVRSQPYEQEKLQQDLGASVQGQQQLLQHRGGRPIQRQCFPKSSADAWSAAAVAAAEVPRGCSAAAHASTYHTGETRQNFIDAGVKSGRSGNGSRNWRDTRRKWESRRGSSSEAFGTSGTEESSSNRWCRATTWRTNGSDRGGENNSYCRYSRSCTEESRSSSREKTDSNMWRERRRCNGEGASSGQENSTLNSGSTHAYTHESAGTFAAAGSAGQWLPNHSAASNCYSAPLVTAESTLESSAAPAAARDTAAATATQAPATALRAAASVETGTQGARGRTHAERWTGRQAAAEADWHPHGAEAAAAAAAENEMAQGIAGTARDRGDAAVGLPAAACSGGVSIRGNRRSIGEHESDVYAGADAAYDGGGVRGGVQTREGQVGCSRKQRESLSPAAALAEDVRGQNPTHLPEGAHSLAAAAASGTREGAEACLPSAAALVRQAAATAEDTESVVRGIAAAAAEPARLCGCSRSGFCCFCVSGVGGDSVRDGERHVEKQAAAAAAVSGRRERGTTQLLQDSAAATETATAAVGVAEGRTGAEVTEGGAAAASAVTDEGGEGAAVAGKKESELRAYLRRVEALNEVLLSNISSLYKTAKAELEKKDAAIGEKDRQIADLLTKLRERAGGGPQEHQQQRGSDPQELHKKYQRQAWQQRLEQPTKFEQHQQHLRQQQQQQLPPYRPHHLQEQQHYLREQLRAKQQRFPQLLKDGDHSIRERR